MAMNFTPTPDVTSILNALLDTYERREPARLANTPTGNTKTQVIRVKLDANLTPDYFSQTDPTPRQSANTQLQQLERANIVRLDWLRGERGHLLATVTLEPTNVAQAYALITRTSIASKRKLVLERLLAERSRIHTHTPDMNDWRVRALTYIIRQLRDGLSPAPFNLDDPALNDNLITALDAIGNIHEETPQRVFSVRVFNDSKRFEQISPKIVTLAKRGNVNWRGFTREEVLCELNIVANPNHLFMFGNWDLIDSNGQVTSLATFTPSVGVPAAQAAQLSAVRANASRVICVENLTSFYELVRHTQNTQPLNEVENVCIICLFGNPSPACRHLLKCLSPETPLFVWADMDYGGFNILAQIRAQVQSSAQALWMDAATFEPHVTFARPLLPNDIKRLTRLLQHKLLGDMQPTIAHLLQRDLKLEQEALRLGQINASMAQSPPL